MKRPWSVTFLALGVLSLTGTAWWRVVQVVQLWDFLASLPLTISPVYMAVTGGLWGLLGMGWAWGLWRGEAWAPAFGRRLALVYAAFHWVDRLVLADRSVGMVNWPFRLGATFLLLGLVYWILSRPRARIFFGERHDR